MNNVATLDQRDQFWSPVKQQKIAKSKLNDLLAAQVHTILFEACDEAEIAMMDPFRLRTALGLSEGNYAKFDKARKLNPNYLAPAEFVELLSTSRLPSIRGCGTPDPWLGYEVRHYENFLLSPLKPVITQMYAMNASQLYHAKEIFQYHLSSINVHPATFKQLIQFALTYRSLGVNATFRLFAVGDVCDNGEEKFPLIYYHKGSLTDRGMRSIRDLVYNGQDVKTLFLGWRSY